MHTIGAAIMTIAVLYYPEFFSAYPKITTFYESEYNNSGKFRADYRMNLRASIMINDAHMNVPKIASILATRRGIPGLGTIPP